MGLASLNGHYHYYEMLVTGIEKPREDAAAACGEVSDGFRGTGRRF